MSDYEREIIYLKRVERGVPMKKGGYVRIERRGQHCSLYIMAGDDGQVEQAPVWLLEEREKGLEAHRMGTMEHGTVWERAFSFSDLFPAVSNGAEGIRQITGVLIGRKEAYFVGACAKYDKEITYAGILFPAEEANDIQAAEQAYDPFLSNLQEMYPFEDDEMEWCVQMEPSDFASFPMELWHYGKNSFLLQGFYNYRHLLYAHSGEKNYVGVPGQFHRREQYLAGRFGFPRFKSVQKRAVRMGDYGYWLKEI